METTPIQALVERVAGEYRAKRSIFDIPEASFRASFDAESDSPGFEVLGTRIQYPVGPAAGPHTQAAPNLIAAYLSGGRVFELKTVQVNDELDIAKPCIDALDEGHNVEWSTEFSLDQAREEYLKGWMVLHVLRSLFAPDEWHGAAVHRSGGFLFNMSVGYTLDGIKSPKMDAFIEGMRAPARTAFWGSALAELEAAVGSRGFREAFGAERTTRAAFVAGTMPSSPVHSVTLSTMHGCPPAEMERIGRYLIEEKGFSTYIKLNPTLLGYDRVRAILDETGWKDIELRRPTFERDLQWDDALYLISSLSHAARAKGVRFGLKLSNTLANVNVGTRLPGEERYMSGRALFPITVRLAAELACSLPESLPFSFCGGVSALNAADCVEAGLGPLTEATDILKPGGYLRLAETAAASARALPKAPPGPSAGALSALAEAALKRPEFRGDWKKGQATIDKPLPAFDCFAAPCQSACPAAQKVSEYIRLSAAGRDEEALSLILMDNPLPFVTGTLCDHVCQSSCCRNDYEGPVRIRSVKLACARAADTRPSVHPLRDDVPGKVAVIGAGPAGLSCAYYLALEGVPVTVFEKAAEPGGVPANVIPRFRIPRADIERDMERIRDLGVQFRFDAPVSGLAPLTAEGFTDLFVGTGAPVPRELPLSGSGVRVVDALEFLAATASDPDAYSGVGRVVVAGGGNTAMDAVRAATRLSGVREVWLSYRRTVNEMPADREELENALAEAVAVNAASGQSASALMELTLPESMSPGKLTLRRMYLSERDASGRRSPKPSEETLELGCDLLVAAVGEAPDGAFLENLGVTVGADGRPKADPETGEARPGIYMGGDVLRGPSSIITAIADGKRGALAILRAKGIEPARACGSYTPPAPRQEKLAQRGRHKGPVSEGNDRALVAREAERCLECDSACLRCVEVCPNRANTFVAVSPAGGGAAFAQGLQVLHLDALCNECGNCGFFCPWKGEPYKDKPTLFASAAALERSKNMGFAYETGSEEPVLVLRAAYEGPPRRLPFAQWSEKAGDTTRDKASLLCALARAALLDHRYLTGGASC
jgi:putative selenate reductase